MTSHLNVLYFNARSINNKVIELQTLLSLNKYDVIMITESWLKTWHKDSFFCNGLDYFVLRSDRRDDERGGGVCVFIKLDLSSRINLISTISEGKEFDLISFDLHFTRENRIRFICAYLPPDSSKDDTVVNNITRHLNSLMINSSTYIVGDFNFDKITWVKGRSLHSNSKVFSCFHDFLLTNSLVQLVTDATQVSGNTLDLFIAPINNIITKISVEEPFTDTCDHYMINACLTLQMFTTSDKRPKKNFYAADYCKINDFLRNIEWPSILDDIDIEQNYQKFIGILQESIDLYVPFTLNKVKPRVPKHLKTLLVQKKKLYKVSKVISTAKEEYKRVEKLYKRLSKEHYRSVEQKVLSSGSVKKFYNFVNKKLKSRNFIPPLFNPVDNVVVTDSDHKAELLNNFFSNCFQNDNEGIEEKYFPDIHIANIMSKIDIKDDDIVSAIKKLKSSVSKTPEGIPALYVKRTCFHLIEPLSILYRKSLRQGKLPTAWTKALVVPIHKKGLRSMTCNYRPVSLTSVFGRLKESILCHYITQHLMDNSLISSAQHGFVEKKSTMTNQLLMLDAVTEKFDNHTQTDMILLDFSKAFDTVPHIKLTSLLQFYKIHPDVCRWIKNHLCARTQQTSVDNSLSKSTKVISGVPQGSVIGPLLFNIYINGLLLQVQAIPNVSVLAFADDLKLISSDYERLKEALLHVQQWCTLFNLKLNPLKSEHLSFKCQTDHTFWICSDAISKVENTKDLGVVIDKSLKWKMNTTKIASKATSISFLILRAFSAQSLDPYVIAYKSYVRPVLEYNTVVWNSCNLEDIRCIENVQKRFTRRLLQRMNIKYANYEDRLRILNLESLQLRRLRYDLVAVYKVLNNLVDIESSQLFEPHTSTYNFRHEHDMTLKNPPTAKRNTLMKSFKHRVINAWNSLSKDTAEAESLATFKKQLQNESLDSFLLSFDQL